MLSREKVPVEIYTVYDHPPSYPDHYVVKRWLVGKAAAEHENVGQDIVAIPDDRFFLQSLELKTCREFLSGMRLTCIGKQPDDAPDILENWI